MGFSTNTLRRLSHGASHALVVPHDEFCETVPHASVRDRDVLRMGARSVVIIQISNIVASVALSGAPTCHRSVVV